MGAFSLQARMKVKEMNFNSDLPLFLSCSVQNIKQGHKLLGILPVHSM